MWLSDFVNCFTRSVIFAVRHTFQDIQVVMGVAQFFTRTAGVLRIVIYGGFTPTWNPQAVMHFPGIVAPFAVRRVT